MTFGDAITALSAGKPVRRAGWPDGRCLFVEAGVIKCIMTGFRAVTWQVPHTAIFADDWSIA